MIFASPNKEERRVYETPELREIGSIEQLTEQKVNKVGSVSDTFTALTDGAVIGSIVPAP
jgi:hypothetical protein